MYVPFSVLGDNQAASLGGSPGSCVSRSGVNLGSHVLMKNVPRSSIQPSKSLSVILLGTFNNEFDGSRIFTGASSWVTRSALFWLTFGMVNGYGPICRFPTSFPRLYCATIVPPLAT